MGLLDEVLGQVLGGATQGQPQSQPQGRTAGRPAQADAGLGGILDMLLRGGDPAGGARRGGPGGDLGDFVDQALGGGRDGQATARARDEMDARERAAKSAAKTQAKLEHVARERAEDAREAAQRQQQGQAGGLDWLMEQFQRAGHGDAAQSWVGGGANRTLSGRQIEDALGRDMVDQLARRSGMSRESMLDQLAQVLPQAVDRLTPGGRMPTQDERGRW